MMCSIYGLDANSNLQLVQQEQDEENKLALQAIKYLGSAGFFSKLAPTS